MKAVYLTLLFLLSLLLTWLTRHHAIRKNILDIPNQRSSHQIPTPRGGGLAIVISFLLAVLAMAKLSLISSSLAYALIGGGLAIAAIGYADDVYGVKARWRFCTHLAAALWAVYWLHGLPDLNLGTWDIYLNNKGSILAVIAIIWAINLYNFMDGIDGLAGSEGLFIALAGGAALILLHQPTIALLLLFLAAAIAGFTFFNWPPAKIFLGDVGSGFLGYIFAVLIISTTNNTTLPIVFWLMIMAVFICDATFTVVYRGLKGARWYAAHREHAYQRLIAHGASHKQVTLGITLLNIFLIMPIAFFGIYHPWEDFWLMASLMSGLFICWLLINIKRGDA